MLSGRELWLKVMRSSLLSSCVLGCAPLILSLLIRNTCFALHIYPLDVDHTARPLLDEASIPKADLGWCIHVMCWLSCWWGLTRTQPPFEPVGERGSPLLGPLWTPDNAGPNAGHSEKGILG